jgi:transcriptional regulator with XRE-family HTH domain
MARGNFGQRLKRERELREVTLEEITSATRIGPRFLEALENEDWEKLPGGVFNRGFLRSIARYLGLDEEALLGEYDLAHGAQVAAAEEPAEKGIPSPTAWFPIAIVLATLLLLAAIISGVVYAWKHLRSRPSAEQTPVSAPALPQTTFPVVQTSAGVPVPRSSAAVIPASGPMDLLVSASTATHLLVLTDGRVAFYDEVHGGDSLHFTANDGFEVTASDSGAVLLELNGQAMPPLGVPGSSGTIKLSHEDLRQAPGGNSQR